MDLTTSPAMDQAGEEVWAGREAGVPWRQRCSPKEVGTAEWRWARLHVVFPVHPGVTADGSRGKGLAAQEAPRGQEQRWWDDLPADTRRPDPLKDLRVASGHTRDRSGKPAAALSARLWSCCLHWEHRLPASAVEVLPGTAHECWTHPDGSERGQECWAQAQPRSPQLPAAAGGLISLSLLRANAPPD